MRHRDAVAMFAGADLASPAASTWADLGCGDGTFTLALAAGLAPGSVVHGLDRDPAAIARIPATSGAVRIETHVGDFTQPSWPFAAALDGILMANSLHYVRDQRRLMHSLVARMSRDGRFLIVEYDTVSSSPWVPFPISRAALSDLFSEIGAVTMLGTRQSAYRRARLYAAMVSRAPAVS